MSDLFSNEDKKVAVIFERVTLRPNKDNDKIAKMRFAMQLDAEVVLACPAEIKAAYEAVDTRDNKIVSVELEQEIPGVNIEFYTLPDSKAMSVLLPTMAMTNLTVERDEQKGRSLPHLLFTLEVSIEEASRLRHWIVDSVFSQMWAKFETAQMPLVAVSVTSSSVGTIDPNGTYTAPSAKEETRKAKTVN